MKLIPDPRSLIPFHKGFTLVELLVVIGMIAVLIAAMGVSVSKAQTRGKIAKATQEVKEMTNAILAFQQYAKGHTLENHANNSWTDCTENNMKMILGGETGENNETVPILFNAVIRGERLVDPWGRPYQYLIQKTEGWDGDGVPDLKTAPALPNYFRLTDKERE